MRWLRATSVYRPLRTDFLFRLVTLELGNSIENGCERRNGVLVKETGNVEQRRLTSTARISRNCEFGRHSLAHDHGSLDVFLRSEAAG